MESGLIELIGAFITGVVGPILYLIITNHQKKQLAKKKDTIKGITLDASMIQNEIEEIRQEFKGCRVWITQFHNGGNYYPTGKSIQKFSIFYEAVNKGISSVAHIFNNIPVSLYPHAFNHLGDKNGIFIADYKDLKWKTYGLREAGTAAGDKSSYVIPLFTLDEKFIGCLGCDYVKRKHRMTKNEWEHFQIKAGRISGYLSNFLEL